ncbi:DUF3291 domain-containing protein [Hyphomonas johnsonii]|jgi:hypothetical protein|uniref:DUF3291 domain-containing protein n=1 Tax=Hyphomonas johnsonii MHS-2 TaxID=1280950 RepID=A0A059F959_9PROT|nr:DUF3291 domain-containing protein [Hyphomonas johnsonii]KCZ87142.1 hypothetical protein HJO_17249 [Hyphomonas johnsonii MHS-2]
MEYRLVHFNCARPLGAFTFENEFVRVFLGILPRIFSDADTFDGLHWHRHGLREPTGKWRDLFEAFPYPVELAAPDVCTMAGWKSIEDMRTFTYSGKTHAPGMRRLQDQLDRTQGPGFVMWWAPRHERFTMEDGWQRLMHLRRFGSSTYAFSLDEPLARPNVA